MNQQSNGQARSLIETPPTFIQHHKQIPTEFFLMRRDTKRTRRRNQTHKYFQILAPCKRRISNTEGGTSSRSKGIRFLQIT